MIHVDLYIGAGRNSEYLGSLKLPGHNSGRLAALDRRLTSESTEHGFRSAALSAVADGGGGMVAGIWPWPWSSSRNTDVTFYWSRRSLTPKMVWFGGGRSWPDMAPSPAAKRH